MRGKRLPGSGRRLHLSKLHLWHIASALSACFTMHASDRPSQQGVRFPSSFFVIFRSSILQVPTTVCGHLQAMSFFSSSVTLASRSTSVSASIFVSTSTVAAAAAASSTLVDDPLSSRTSYFSSTLTSLIACLALMLGFMYLAVLSWAWRYSKRNPRALNKTSGVLIQRHAPSIYVFLVLGSLVEVAIASWLTLQYRFNHNYPNVEVRTSARLLLFASCWTSLTAGAYSIVFLHSTWSKHPMASIGAQAIWIFVTWLFWIVGAGILNSATSSFLVHGGMCGPGGVVYCSQIRALFGVAVVESFMLSGGILAMLWLAWQSARYIFEPASFQMQ